MVAGLPSTRYWKVQLVLYWALLFCLFVGLVLGWREERESAARRGGEKGSVRATAGEQRRRRRAAVLFVLLSARFVHFKTHGEGGERDALPPDRMRETSLATLGFSATLRTIIVVQKMGAQQLLLLSLLLCSAARRHRARARERNRALEVSLDPCGFAPRRAASRRLVGFQKRGDSLGGFWSEEGSLWCRGARARAQQKLKAREENEM